MELVCSMVETVVCWDLYQLAKHPTIQQTNDIVPFVE